MKKSDKNKKIQVKIDRPNECPKKDKDGNCLVPGAYGDSDPIGGGWVRLKFKKLLITAVFFCNYIKIVNETIPAINEPKTLNIISKSVSVSPCWHIIFLEKQSCINSIISKNTPILIPKVITNKKV